MKISSLIKDKQLYRKVFPYNYLEFQTINPVNNKLITKFDFDTDADIKDKIASAHQNFLSWRNTDLDERLNKMKKLSKNLEKHKVVLAGLITLEMGKPIKESIAEINKSINHINYYLTHSKNFLKHREYHFENFENKMDFNPLGVILAINPWNFPVWVGFKSIIPALIAGNTILFKPSATVPQTNLKLVEIFKESDMEDKFSITFTKTEDIGEKLIAHPKIRSIIFTGSTNTGSIVGSLAGKYLKKSLLELGGSDPFIVFDDADLEKSVIYAAEGRLRNTGQACICSKRILIHEKIYEEFKHKLIKEVEKYKMGDPTDPINKIGPVARFDLFINLKRQILQSLEGGAKLVNANHLDFSKDLDDSDYNVEKGNFQKPIILENIAKSCVAYSEEIFGPVFSLYKFRDYNEAIELANDTEFGLGASIMSKDLKKADEFAKKLDCGMVFINSSTFSDSRLPYGGTKNSGYGKTSADSAFFEFTNNKVISAKLS